MVLSISPLIEEPADMTWVNRGFFHSKKLMLLIWNLSGQIILWGYKAVLLVHLIAITYEKPLHSSHDVAASGLPIYLPVEWYQYLYDTDPREEMREIGKNGILYNYAGFIPQYVWDQ